MPFFHGSTLKQVKPPITSTAPKCGLCLFHKQTEDPCDHPKMEVSGEGKKKILIVSAYPGVDEDTAGRQFVGPSGKYLKSVLRRNGIEMREDCWLDNALICRPPLDKKGHIDSSKVTPNHVRYCQPTTIKAIKQLNPEVIILAGSEAVQSVLGWLYRENVGRFSKWPGYMIPNQQLNAWIIPTYNPAGVLKKDKTQNVRKIYFEEHLEHASNVVGERPWGTVRDYKADVDIVLDVEKAARILRKMIHKGGTVAADYEATMIKPEGAKAEIVSCAVCWNGRKTIAFPWSGEAIKAMRELWRSPLAKIAANLKFEDRWTKKMLGTRTRNWYYDTMLGAHAIDSREGTKSLDFQAFVRLGVRPYNEHLKEYLRGKTCMTPNKIKQEIEINDLLLYNGLDAILEFEVAREQMKILQIPFPEGMK